MNQFDPSRAFLDEVLAHPDDDGPRLVYADFLEEQGDCRGEFIRLQCELSGLDELDPRYLDLSHRCDELLFENQAVWAGELKQDVRKAEFSRGFIDKITIGARAFIKEADALYQSTPVRWLRFNRLQGVGEQLAATEALASVRFLDLAGLKIPEEDLIALLTSPHLRNLEALRLSHSELGLSDSIGLALAETPSAGKLLHLELPGEPDFLRAVGRGGGFPRLEYLAVGTQYLQNDDVSGLAKFKVPSLKRLKVRGRISAADANAIATLPLDQLQELDLDGTWIPAKGLRTLAERGALDAVECLSLAACDLRVRGVDVLFQGDRLRHCQRLNLKRNPNLRQGKNRGHFVHKLVGHQPLARLKQLRMCNIEPQDIRFLARAKQLDHLELLELDDSQLGADGLAILAESPMGQSLKRLKLTGCDAQTVQRLTGRAFPKLLRLDLSGGYHQFSGIDTAAVIAFMSSPAFANIQEITLSFLNLRSKALMAIAQSAELPELRQISCLHNHASRKAVDAVMNAPGLPKLAKLVLKGTSGLSNKEKLLADYGSKVKF